MNYCVFILPVELFRNFFVVNAKIIAYSIFDKRKRRF